jgi:hypothetical protein
MVLYLLYFLLFLNFFLIPDVRGGAKGKGVEQMLASTFLFPSLLSMAVYAIHKFSLVQRSDKHVKLHNK